MSAFEQIGFLTVLIGLTVLLVSGMVLVGFELPVTGYSDQFAESGGVLASEKDGTCGRTDSNRARWPTLPGLREGRKW
jgi:hypothetical protein